ncbi:hypothetical protein CHARACLAT_027692 [Characodon lateralis]|uniref:Secreted protein n=1 Tax=Characodon lateralis TaxID=208331 RepID=A0ABU7EX95_9TELE|nr:hypothetical protein [Characodon lateralis]
MSHTVPLCLRGCISCALLTTYLCMGHVAALRRSPVYVCLGLLQPSRNESTCPLLLLVLGVESLLRFLSLQQLTTHSHTHHTQHRQIYFYTYAYLPTHVLTHNG